MAGSLLGIKELFLPQSVWTVVHGWHPSKDIPPGPHNYPMPATLLREWPLTCHTNTSRTLTHSIAGKSHPYYCGGLGRQLQPRATHFKCAVLASSHKTGTHFVLSASFNLQKYADTRSSGWFETAMLQERHWATVFHQGCTGRIAGVVFLRDGLTVANITHLAMTAKVDVNEVVRVLMVRPLSEIVVSSLAYHAGGKEAHQPHMGRSVCKTLSDIRAAAAKPLRDVTHPWPPWGEATSASGLAALQDFIHNTLPPAPTSNTVPRQQALRQRWPFHHDPQGALAQVKLLKVAVMQLMESVAEGLELQWGCSGSGVGEYSTTPLSRFYMMASRGVYPVTSAVVVELLVTMSRELGSLDTISVVLATALARESSGPWALAGRGSILRSFSRMLDRDMISHFLWLMGVSPKHGASRAITCSMLEFQRKRQSGNETVTPGVTQGSAFHEKAEWVFEGLASGSWDVEGTKRGSVPEDVYEGVLLLVEAVLRLDELQEIASVEGLLDAPPSWRAPFKC